MNWLIEAIQSGPVLSDGAMGTMLIAAGLPPGSCPLRWNAERPDILREVHRQYSAAGSYWATANTFGGSSFALARYGLEDRGAELNAAAVYRAREGVGDGGKVLGDVGPFGGFLEPYGDATADEVRRMLEFQIGAMYEAGADGIIIETMVDPVEVSLAVRVARDIADWPVIATYAFQRSGDSFRTIMGTTVKEAMEAAIAAGSHAVGANCGTDLSLDDYLRLAKEMLASSYDVPIIVQPNGGAPQEIDGELVYKASPNDFADWSSAILEVGVKIVGGCCGTTPDHIRAISERVHVSA